MVWDIILALAGGFEAYVRSEQWKQRASCRGMDTARFFPSRGRGGMTVWVIDECYNTAAICAECAVQEECRNYAFMSKEVGNNRLTNDGIWAGYAFSRQARRGRVAWANQFRQYDAVPPTIERLTADSFVLRVSSAMQAYVPSDELEEATVTTTEFNQQLVRVALSWFPHLANHIARGGFRVKTGALDSKLAFASGLGPEAVHQRLEVLKELDLVRVREEGPTEVLLLTERGCDVREGRVSLEELQRQAGLAVASPAPTPPPSPEEHLHRRQAERDQRFNSGHVSRQRRWIQQAKQQLSAEDIDVLKLLEESSVSALGDHNAMAVLGKCFQLTEPQMAERASSLKQRGYVLYDRYQTPGNRMDQISITKSGRLALVEAMKQLERAAESEQREAEVPRVPAPVAPSATAAESASEPGAEDSPANPSSDDLPNWAKSRKIVTSITLNALRVLYALPKHKLQVDGDPINYMSLLAVMQTQGNVPQALRRWVAKGLVKIDKPSPSARRINYVELTKFGEQVLLYWRPELAVQPIAPSDPVSIAAEDADDSCSRAEVQKALDAHCVDDTAHTSVQTDDEPPERVLASVPAANDEEAAIAAEVVDLSAVQAATEEPTEALGNLPELGLNTSSPEVRAELQTFIAAKLKPLYAERDRLSAAQIQNGMEIAVLELALSQLGSAETESEGVGAAATDLGS